MVVQRLPGTSREPTGAVSCAPVASSTRKVGEVRSAIAHLYRRVGFGATPDEMEAALAAGYPATLDRLLDLSAFDFDAERIPSPTVTALPDPLPANGDERRAVQQRALNETRAMILWWLDRMVVSHTPLREKLTFFWHGHFATAYTKVREPLLLYRQNQLLRSMATGNFEALTQAVAKDPAMILWLDTQTNEKGKPNENFSRELMELFTLGAGHFTEPDVRELARAFTGWQVRDGQAELEKSQFDDGEKTILGATGKFDSESAIDVILKQPAAPKFLARKLLAEFVHPDPPAEYVEHFAARLVANNWEIKPTLREMLGSRMFFSEWAYRSRIKSPAELCVGGALAVGGKIETRYVRDSMARMGQNLLFPPNVAGWKGGEQWVNANTLLVRMNYGLALAQHRGNEYARRPDLRAELDRRGVKSADDVIEHYAKVLLDGRVPDHAQPRLRDYMNRDEKGETKTFELSGGTVASKVRGVVHLMMALPEYQLA